MSVKIMGRVWELSMPADEKFVLLALADHADHEGNHVHPGVAMIAAKTGYSERKVQYILRRLERSGLLEKEANDTGGRGRRAEYRIDLSKGARSAPFMGNDEANVVRVGRDSKGADRAPFVEGKRVQDSAAKGCKISRAPTSLTVNRPFNRQLTAAPLPPTGGNGGGGGGEKKEDDENGEQETGYPLLLGGLWSRVSGEFARLHPDLSTTWLRDVLDSAPEGLDREQLKDLLSDVCDVLEAKIRADRDTPAEHRIRNWRAFAARRMHEAMREKAR